MQKGRVPFKRQQGNSKMTRWLTSALAAGCFPLAALAQSSDAGPIATPAGSVQFSLQGREAIVTLQGAPLDHYPASNLVHFDDLGDANPSRQASDTVQRILVDTDAGPVLYDFRHRPPTVQTIGVRMTVRRVFWQGDEVVMQGSKGWFRFEHGTLTKLHYSKMTFH